MNRQSATDQQDFPNLLNPVGMFACCQTGLSGFAVEGTPINWMFG